MKLLKANSFSCSAQKFSNILATAILISSLLIASYGAYKLYMSENVQEWLIVLMLLPLLYLPLYAFSMVVVLFSRNYIKEKYAEYAGFILAFILLPIYLLQYFEDILIYVSVPILALFHLLMILSKGCNEDIVVEDVITPEQF